MINNKKQLVVEPGKFTVSIGGKQPDGSADILTGRIKITGKTIILEK